MRLIHIQSNTGVLSRLKHCEAANFQRQLRKIPGFTLGAKLVSS